MAEPNYNKHERQIVSGILGEHMHRVITHRAVDTVRTNGIARQLSHRQAFLRWGNAMAWVADPVAARRKPSDLEAPEITALETAARPQSAANLASEALRRHKALRRIIRGQTDLKEMTASRMSELLISGASDSLSWINVLRSRGLAYDEIADHPIFPTMTTLTSPAHTLMLMVYGGITMETVPAHVPRRRADVMEVVQSCSPLTKALAYKEAEATPPYRSMEIRGDCPAAIGRDAHGQTWLHVLVEKAVELHLNTANEPQPN